MLDEIRGYIEQRRLAHKRENALTSAYWVVEALDSATCQRALYTPVCSATLPCGDADLAQMLAAKLGQTITWRHVRLGSDIWREGRGH